MGHNETTTDHFVTPAERDLRERLAFTVKAAAALLSVSPKTIRRLIASGDVKSTRIARRVIIAKEEVERLRGSA